MRMNRFNRVAPMLAVLIVILLSSSLTVVSQAADYTKIGVKVGDRAVYSTDCPSYDRTRIEVSGVAGSYVNLTITDYWSNGTVVDTSTHNGNVSSDDQGWLVCAGLQEGDYLWVGSSYVFDDTFSMEIAGAARTVNLLIHEGDHLYFDQTTGILVKLVCLPGGWWNYTMISTNMWEPDNHWVPILIGGVMGAVAVVAVAAMLIRRRGK